MGRWPPVRHLEKKYRRAKRALDLGLAFRAILIVTEMEEFFSFL